MKNMVVDVGSHSMTPASSEPCLECSATCIFSSGSTTTTVVVNLLKAIYYCCGRDIVHVYTCTCSLSRYMY